MSPFGTAPAVFRETLALGVDEDGVSHALYPTATATLCGRSSDLLDVVAGHDTPPDCLVCATTAAAFDRVDRSAPAGWYRHPKPEQPAKPPPRQAQDSAGRDRFAQELADTREAVRKRSAA